MLRVVRIEQCQRHVLDLHEHLVGEKPKQELESDFVAIKCAQVREVAYAHEEEQDYGGVQTHDDGVVPQTLLLSLI